MNDKAANPKVVRSKAATVVMSLAKESRLSEVGKEMVQSTSAGRKRIRTDFDGFKSKEE